MRGLAHEQVVQQDVARRPESSPAVGDASPAKRRRQRRPRKPMNPSSFNWLLSVNSTANQMKVASTSPCCAMSCERDRAGGEQHAQAEKRDGRRVESERRRQLPTAPPCRRRRRGRSIRRASADRAPRAPSGPRPGASGVDAHFGSDELVEQQRQQRHRADASARRRRAAIGQTRSRRRSRARLRRRAGWPPWPSATAPTRR